MRTFIALSIITLSTLTSASAWACRCAIPSTPSLIESSDAIVAGAVLWTHTEGFKNYTAVRFDKLVHTSKRAADHIKTGLESEVAQGTIGFFRGNSRSNGTCPGNDVSLPVGTRLAYVATLGDHGTISIEGERIGHCNSFRTYFPAGSQRYRELSNILGEL